MLNSMDWSIHWIQRNHYQYVYQVVIGVAYYMHLTTVVSANKWISAKEINDAISRH